MPITLKRWYLGSKPNGLNSPEGLIAVITVPTVAPTLSAKSFPITMGGYGIGPESEAALLESELAVEPEAPLGLNPLYDPACTLLRRSLTRFSDSGTMPFRSAPPERAPLEIRTSSYKAGAAACTCGCFSIWVVSSRQFRMPSLCTRIRLICAVERIRLFSRSWRKPLLIARATISEATPAATPATEIK